MTPEHSRWLLAFAAASLIGYLARRRRSLSPDGMIAAIVTGTILVGAAGWWAGLLLVAFFLSSSLLSRRPTGQSDSVQARGDERDAVQVFANGGVALLAGVLFAFTGESGWILFLAGSIAAANSDTWSTEIGRTSRALPRLVTTWRPVPAGTSGAVSARGLTGALAGGALIGGVAAVGWWLDTLPGAPDPIAGLLAVSFGGFTGSLLDSLLGATIQDQRWCDMCNKSTEQPVHRCGTPTRSVKGVAWIDNDVVNLSCVIAGGVVAWAIATLVT